MEAYRRLADEFRWVPGQTPMSDFTHLLAAEVGRRPPISCVTAPMNVLRAKISLSGLRKSASSVDADLQRGES